MSQDYTTTFTVDAPPSAVFAAINDVRGWWGEGVDGRNDRVGDEFTYRVDDVHFSRLRVLELVPDEKVVWGAIENRISFVEDPREWDGTTIRFELRGDGAQTTVRFAHVGLVPAFECYDVCSTTWASLMHGSLRDLILTGTGRPFPRQLASGAA